MVCGQLGNELGFAERFGGGMEEAEDVLGGGGVIQEPLHNVTQTLQARRGYEIR